MGLKNLNISCVSHVFFVFFLGGVRFMAYQFSVSDHAEAIYCCCLCGG